MNIVPFSTNIANWFWPDQLVDIIKQLLLTGLQTTLSTGVLDIITTLAFNYLLEYFCAYILRSRAMKTEFDSFRLQRHKDAEILAFYDAI